MSEKFLRKTVRFLSAVEFFIQRCRIKNLNKLQKECPHDYVVEFITSKGFELSERFCAHCFLEENSLNYNGVSGHKHLASRPVVSIINSDKNPRPKFNALKNLVKSTAIGLDIKKDTILDFLKK
ncbi:MAG: hypothetical protein UT37_C0010G0002 [Parcubacteria group bacterium GW2011_GWA2_39_18]|nr:MAG: hypothetical protein UT37_C0010G0002 [Parcubacteria group bacterium GW2011_GWA2_39_18]